MKVLVLILALTAVTLSAHVSQAQSRPPRTTHEGDTGPEPADSSPGHYGSGDSVTWERPSRDVDHGSSWDRDSSSSWRDHDSYDRGSYDHGSYNHGSYGRGGYHHRDHSGSGSYSGGTEVYCAPKDLQSNVAKTDVALKALASSKDFATAAKFKSAVKGIGAMANPAARADAYMKLAGIDANDSKAVFAFVGAREARGTWIVELQRNAGLTEKQAEKTATTLQSALRGGLN